MSEPDLNPYAPPQTTNFGPVAFDSPFEEMRRYHLSHETSVRSFSLLYFLGGGILIIVSFVMIMTAVGGRGGFGVIELGLLPLMFAMGIAQIAVAIGLRRLTTFGRIGGSIFAAVGMLSIPVGTILGIYLLYLLWSAKGQVVFTPRYKEVIAQTPHVKYKTSIIAWIGLILFGGLLLLLIVSVLVSRVL